jgi:monofunctional biosynthetic peptidoglycan transglycosylase
MLDHPKHDADGAPSDGAAPDGNSGGNSGNGGDAASTGSGGELGRFRAGMTATPGDPPGKPVWRRLLVGFLVWGSAAAAAFLALSAAAVYLIGWTGPPATMNMTIKAMDGVEVRRTWVQLKDVSPHLVRAVISAEDQRFCTHDGFDVVEIQKAIEAAERGRDLRGASTISQQTAKNVFLWNGGGWFRKGLEVWFTFLAETMWSKPRIMEIYLNVAEWGDGLYGIEAAAQARFGVSAKDLTSRQSALLAAVLPSPNRWRVDGNYAGRRAGQIQSLMRMTRRDGLDDCVIR